MKQYMIECPCGEIVSRSFYNELIRAKETLELLDETGCGSDCNPITHKLIELEMEIPEKEGEVFLEGEKGFHSELIKVMRFDPAINDSIKDMEEEEKAFPSDKE